ncbi:hypothetical protein ACWEWI_27685 [Streptomyces sp. NPDC003753]
MSTGAQRPLAGGSGPARWQRIASNAQFSRTQRAYRAYMDHCGGCATCAVDSRQCPTAEELWAAYRAATSS